jgi:hypothetical protein
VEASYGPSEQDSGTKDLVMDVTIALQALVHNSQVYIAGHRTKVSQGYDRTLDSIHTYSTFAVRYTGLLRPCSFVVQVSPSSICLPWKNALRGDSGLCPCCSSARRCVLFAYIVRRANNDCCALDASADHLIS